MPELSDTLQRLLRLTHELIPFDRGTIYLAHEGALLLCATWSCAEGEPDARRRVGARLELANGFKGKAVPIRWEGEVIGVLELESYTSEHFQGSHQALADLVTEQAAVVIHYAHLAKERQTLLRAEQWERQLSEALRRMSKALSAASLEMESMTAIVLDHLRELLPYDSASISLLEGGRLAFVASRGRRAPQEGEQIALDELQLSRWVIENRQPLRLGEAGEGPLERNHRFQQHHSWLGAPLIANDQVIGVLSCDAIAPYAYSAREEQVIAALADQAAFALQNVSLLSMEVATQQQLEEQMRQYLDGMLMVHRVGVLMGGEQELPHLLELVCQQATVIGGAKQAAVGLLTEEQGQELRIAAAHGPGSDGWGGRIEQLDSLIAKRALVQRQPFLLMQGITPPADLERFQAHWRVPSAVILPLEARNRVIGVLLVFGRDQARGGAHSLQLLQIFASQAAVTIDNLHLLQETQRRQAELEALTEYNTLLIETSPVGIAVLDPEGRFVRANPAFRATIAPETVQIEGKPLAQLFPQVEQTTLAQMVQATLESGTSHRSKAFYYPYLARGARWFDLSFTPLRDSQERITGVMMTLMDITQLKQLEEDLRQRNERSERQLVQHRALYEMGTQINADLDVQRVLEALMISVRSSFLVDGMTMLMPTEQRASFEFVSAFGLSANYLAREQVLYEVSANGRAIAQLAPILIADIAKDERMGPLRVAAQQEGLQTALFLPFVYRDEVVGLMSLYHRQPHRYTLEEMELLAIFANQATTAIKNAQFYTSIVQSRSNLNAILHSMTDGVLALDEQGCVTFINQPLFDLLNIPPAPDWVGRSSEELWPQLRELLQTSSTDDPLAPAEREGVRRVEVDLQTPPRTLELIHSPILDEQGYPIGRLLLLHDITEIRSSERMKDELISIISHELRTPLTTILGYSKLLLDRPDSPVGKRNRWITHILDKSRLLNRLVDEMLDLSRLNMQRFEIKPEPTDLAALVRRAAKEHRVMTDQHTIQIEFQGDLSAVPLDADRIDQLLSNFLINAIKYSPEGGVILIRATRGDDWLHLSVSDEGLGIAPDHHERIFEPFFRVDQSTTRDVYGTGLGLPLCQGIAEAHGGYITLESELGRGSTFTAHFPL